MCHQYSLHSGPGTIGPCLSLGQPRAAPAVKSVPGTGAAPSDAVPNSKTRSTSERQISDPQTLIPLREHPSQEDDALPCAASPGPEPAAVRARRAAEPLSYFPRRRPSSGPSTTRWRLDILKCRDRECWRVASMPSAMLRLRRGGSVEATRGAAAATTWRFCGGGFWRHCAGRCAGEAPRASAQEG